MSDGNYFYIGSSPNEEKCAAVGITEMAGKWSRHECKAYIVALTRKYGDPEPVGCEFRVKSQAHDFGNYYEVVCHFNANVAGSVDYAQKTESGVNTWTEVDMVAPVVYDDRSQATKYIPDVEDCVRKGKGKPRYVVVVT